MPALVCTTKCGTYPCTCFSPQQHKDNRLERSVEALETIAAALSRIAQGTTTTTDDERELEDPQRDDEERT